MDESNSIPSVHFPLNFFYWSFISQYIFLPQLYVLKLLDHSKILPLALSNLGCLAALNSIRTSCAFIPALTHLWRFLCQSGSSSLWWGGLGTSIWEKLEVLKSGKMSLLSVAKALSLCCLGQDYPFPMVNHKEASDHNLQLMKQVREEQHRTAQLTRGKRCCSTHVPCAVTHSLPQEPRALGLGFECF